MKPQIKLDSRTRVAQILAAALDLAPRVGYTKLTRDEVAARAGIPSSLICYHMGTMVEFRRALMREAIRVECLAVIAQGLVFRHPLALKAPIELRNRAIEFLAA